MPMPTPPSSCSRYRGIHAAVREARGPPIATIGASNTIRGGSPCRTRRPTRPKPPGRAGRLPLVRVTPKRGRSNPNLPSQAQAGSRGPVNTVSPRYVVPAPDSPPDGEATGFIDPMPPPSSEPTTVFPTAPAAVPPPYQTPAGAGPPPPSQPQQYGQPRYDQQPPPGYDQPQYGHPRTASSHRRATANPPVRPAATGLRPTPYGQPPVRPAATAGLRPTPDTASPSTASPPTALANLPVPRPLSNRPARRRPGVSHRSPSPRPTRPSDRGSATGWPSPWPCWSSWR